MMRRRMSMVRIVTLGLCNFSCLLLKFGLFGTVLGAHHKVLNQRIVERIEGLIRLIGWPDGVVLYVVPRGEIEHILVDIVVLGHYHCIRIDGAVHV